MNHPNICTIYEARQVEGETYIAMELVEGRPLSALLGRDGLPAETVIRYGTQLADALAHAQDRGVVHRDLKGANVVVTPDGRPKILDFGLARRAIEETEEATRTLEPLTAEGAVAGTVPYMAPEVLRGEPADTRSDLWALGVILYQAVTGRLPFEGRTAFDMTSAILRDTAPPLPASVPPGLAMIIQRLLAKPAGERYQRASEVRAALEATQPHVNPAAVVPERPSRRRWLWAAGALPVAAALAWLGGRSSNRMAAPATGPRLSDGSRPSANAEASEYYERGLLFSGSGPRSDLPQWRRMLERALELDPKFAAARGQYAFTSMLPAYFGQSIDAAALYKAEEEARQALRDDPECAVAHSALAGIYLLSGARNWCRERWTKRCRRMRATRRSTCGARCIASPMATTRRQSGSRRRSLRGGPCSHRRASIMPGRCGSKAKPRPQSANCGVPWSRGQAPRCSCGSLHAPTSNWAIFAPRARRWRAWIPSSAKTRGRV